MGIKITPVQVPEECGRISLVGRYSPRPPGLGSIFWDSALVLVALERFFFKIACKNLFIDI